MADRLRESPTRTDPVAAAMSAVVGGPVGVHSAGHRWWSPGRVLLVATGAALAAGMLAKSACVPSGWSKDAQPFAQLCWTDVAGRSADSGLPPHVAGWLGEAARHLPGSGTVAATAWLALLLATLALIATALLVRVEPRRPWAAAGWALAPVLVAHWLSWDLVPAVGVAVLLWGWVTGRPWVAGIAAGVGVAFALPVVAALVGVVAVGRTWRDRAATLLAAAGAYVVVALPGRAVTEVPDVGSVWLYLGPVGSGGASTLRTVTSLVVLGLAGVAGLWLVRRSSGPTPRLAARVGLLLLVAALVVAPSAPPETSLLVLPLAALAIDRWRDLLVWQGTALVSWVITGWYVGGAIEPTVTGDSRAYWIAILLRVAGLAWLAVAVLADAAQASVDDHPVDVRRREPDAHGDLVADLRDPGA